MLETDASKEYYGAIIKVKRDNKEYIAGYQFSTFNKAQLERNRKI